MPNDNTLGAPTEGLGQTVTFGFNVSDKPGAVARSRGRINSGVQGQGQGSSLTLAQGVKVEGSETVDLLMKAGQGLIDNKIKEARTAAYVSGMQRAMAGEAVDDIAANQPAWSRVFGDSDAVEGARAYSAEDKVQKVLLSIEEDMPNLRKLDAGGAKAFFIKSLNSAMTGHAATDNAIMSAVSRSLPGVMKRHSSAHYAYMQEEATTQEANALDSAAARLQSAGEGLARGELTPDDFAERKASVSMLSVPAMGRDPENVQKQRTASALLMLEKGQFHAVNALRDIGVFDVLRPEQKAQIIRAREANETQWKAKYGQEFAAEIADLRLLDEKIKLGQLPGWSPEDTMVKVQELNKKYKERTGSETDFYNPEHIAAYGERTGQAIAAIEHKQVAEAARQVEAARAAGQKELEAQAIKSTFDIAVSQGNLGSALSMGLIKDNDADKLFVPAAMSAINNILTSKPGSLDLIIRNGIKGYTNKTVAGQIQGLVHEAVVGGKMSPSFIATYETWRQLNEGSPRTAAAYFGEDHVKFQRFSLVNPGPISPQSHFLQAAFEGSFGPGAKRYGATLDKKQVSELIKKSTDVLNPNWANMPEMLGGDNKLRPGQAEKIANAVINRVEVLNDSTNLEQAMFAGITIGTATDIHVVGGYMWYDSKNRNFVGEMSERLKGKFGLGSKLEVSQDFGELLDERIKAIGGMPNPTVVRDEGGFIITDSVEGKPRLITLTLDAVAEELMKRGQKRRGPKPELNSAGEKKTWYRFGGEITSTEARDAQGNPLVPSIYNRK